MGPGHEPDRNAYLELAPELEPYFVTSRYDDDRGITLSTLARPAVRIPFQGFVAIPGVIAVLDAVVAGAAVGIAGLGLDLGTGRSLALGAGGFLVTLGAFVVYAFRTVGRHRRSRVVRFPTPAADDDPAG